MNSIIYFEPKYKIGDEVALKINHGMKMVVDSYRIDVVSDVGEVQSFIYGLYNVDGCSYTFLERDLIEYVKTVI